MDYQNTQIKTAVVLDDDADTRFALKRILDKCGCTAHEAESVEEALAFTETHDIDVIFSDIRIPGEDGGEELLEMVVSEQLDVFVVLMSCAMDSKMRKELMEKGANECVQKPFFAEQCKEILLQLSGPYQKSA